MTTPVIHHLSLSVQDIDRSADWYARLFELTLVAELDEPAPMKIFRTDGGQAIDLRQDPHAVAAIFTQTRVGLDHVGFICTDQSEFDRWTRRLQEFGVATSGVEESPFGRHLNFRDPDGIPLEFFLPAKA